MKKPIEWMSIFLISVLSFLSGGPARGQKTSARERADLIAAGGTIATMDDERRIIEDGAIAVKGDAIVAIGKRAEIEAKYTAPRRIQAQGKLILPGLINGHTHAPMTLLRGLKDDVTLEEWLTKYIFPAEAKNVNEDFVRWGTRLATAEQIRGGVTTFADMYYFEYAVAAAQKASGKRGV